MFYYPKTFPKNKEGFLKKLVSFLLTKAPKDKMSARKLIHEFLAANNENIKDYFPSYWHILFVYYRHFYLKNKRHNIVNVLRTVSVRSLSGIVPLSVFTKPRNSCPFNCVYCPTADNAPKSYFPDEAAVMRAIRNEYDPFLQIQDRLVQFFLNGHSVDKVELIIQGGTFSFYDKEYREEFVKRLFDSLNTNVKELIIKGKTKFMNGRSLDDAKFRNETAVHRAIGLTIETRPDFINKDEVKFLRKLGVTRVELGVQSLDNEVLRIVRRGHTVRDTIKATNILRRNGFKIVYHIMPGLPVSSDVKDLETLRKTFQDVEFRPDAIKFYPTQIVWGTELLKWYKTGKYKAYTSNKLLKLSLNFKKNIVPRWTRVNRLVRDLTKNDVAVHTFPSNFRQTLEKELHKRDIKCPCIRCREIRNQKVTELVRLKITKYKVLDGVEVFLEFVDKEDKLLGFLRLFLPSSDQRLFFSSLKECALIRELHIYGKQVEIGKKGIVQHKGLGKKLLEESFEVARKKGFNKIAVISGVGVREYYRGLGFGLNKNGEYMIRIL